MSSAITRRRRLLGRGGATDASPPIAGSARVATAASPWRWRLVLIGFSLVLLIWALPMIIAATPLRNTLLGMAVKPEQGTITSQGASLGWFSPIELRGLMIHDKDQELLLVAESIRTSKSLLGFLTDSRNLGKIRVERPEAQVRLGFQNSNVEEFIEPWMESEGESELPTMELEIVDGKLLLVDTTTGRQWHAEQLEATTSLTEAVGNPLAIKVSTAITDGLEPGRIQGEFSLPLNPTATTGAGSLKLQTQRLPLLMLHGLLARINRQTHLYGTMTSDVECSWSVSETESPLTLRGQINVDQFTLDSEYLQGDRLQLAHLELPCHLVIDQNRMLVHGLAVRCDLGQVSASGSLNLAALEGNGFLSALLKENYKVEGKLDLARLAAALPKTLHVREGTAVTSGTAALNLASSTEPAGHRWQGQLQTQGLTAIANGQQVAWEQPMLVQAQALEHAAGLNIEQLVCQSEFLTLSASGTPDKLVGKAEFDLTELMAKLDQFVDLGAWRIAGQGQADLAWNRGVDGAFRAGAAVALQNFELSTPDGAPWQDGKLLVEATAAGRWAEGQLVELAEAEAHVAAAPDELHVVLTDAVVGTVNKASAFPVNLTLKGNLARWEARLRPFVDLQGWQLDGETTLSAQMLVSATSIEAQQATWHVDQFAFDGAGLFIREPVLELTGAGRWTTGSSRLDLGACNLRGNDLLVETGGASLELGNPAGPSLAGKLRLLTTVERLHQYTLDPAKQKENRAPGTMIYTGRIDGTADFQHAGKQTTAVLNVSFRPLNVLQRVLLKTGRISNQGRWSEPDLNVAASGVYDRSADQLQLSSATIAGQSVAMSAAGMMNELQGPMRLDLSGKLQYDLEPLMPLLEKFVGAGIALKGREQGSFALKGPLWGTPDRRGVVAPWSQRLVGNLSLGWKQGQVYGLEVGAGTTTAALEKGVVRFSPIKVPLSEGELTSAPVIQLDPAPAAVYLPKGPLLTNVRLSPEFSDAWLKYAAPVLAEATRTDGKISIDLDGGRIPLDSPATSDVGGRLILHQVQVMPGPLAKDYILLGQQIEAIMKRRVPPAALEGQQSALVAIADQTVAFRMLEGRVHHQNLIAGVAGTTLTTQGSVGVDQTLALTAQMPVADRWLGTDPALQGFKGQLMQVNIGGTLSKPALDKRSIEQLAGQLVRGAVQNTIQSELSKQLDRLLPLKK